MKINIVLMMACAILSYVAFGAWAEPGKLTLKDGSVVEGDITKLGSSYSVKTPDGQRRLIPEKDVDNLTGGPAAPKIAGTDATSEVTGSAEFMRTKRTVDKVDSADLGVSLWQKFVDDNPSSPDLATAKAELQRWQEMAKDGAERIKGKWVSGKDIKDLHEKVDKMMKEFASLMEKNQTLKAVDKLQEVVKVYPNSFEAHFELGFFYLMKGSKDTYDKAITSLEMASKLRPKSAASFSNLAIAYCFSKRWEDSIVAAQKAVEIEDSRSIVQNLVNSIAFAPRGLQNSSSRVKKAAEEATLLASKYGINGPTDQFYYVRPKPEENGDEDIGEEKRQGIIGSGTGFFISDSGLIMTNRHVAGEADFLIVILSDGTQKIAEKVVVDKEQDIAVLRIKSEKTPFIPLADYAKPPEGTEVTVMGFPLGALFGSHVKITRGVVTAVESKEEFCDVIVDAQVNPGNSGGPMIDKYGHLLALVAMKSFADDRVSSYGMGMSPERLRKFFKDNKDTLPDAMPSAKGGETLTTEDIAQKYTKSVVMILIGKGKMPEDYQDGKPTTRPTKPGKKPR